ncbi:serine/threonine-protein kinase [Micromonospora narathiwatensis]|uniref:non-specific serine/threonine protein kinase n=1 Tax=Micromonospora narathiwatensis TaxID=299146 RepID=A0A1A8ZRS5_9ACTN|nr:serine/threonine-protein kinase [Micromonospora narathiwatensis]SBT46534.1 serine/threonine-protein kinase PknG [Micromonospora narathiwatensis]
MRCVRSGCPGSYGAEGYCDECGRRAPAGAVVAPPGGSVATAAATMPSVATISAGSARTGSGRSRPSARGGLGAGLIDIPRVPLRDPATAVMSDPKVAESRRFCTGCDAEVGRGRDGRPGRVEGYCPHCGHPFSFVPRLRAGDLVNDRYEVLGALAYGGLGWIYLARDRNVSDSVSDRWVVLKGLINTGDADAMAAAVTERRFLVEIDHPNIVKIHDFVQHPDPKTGERVGYIVMEYVGGQSLRDMLVARRAEGVRVLPLPEVIAYGVEILPALGYLHDRGLIFCDFKPDNVIHAEEQLKLIDLGGVRRADDDVSAIYGTPGYQAPEVATAGPSVASDIYTVGRSLAVLSFEFRGFASTYADRLPEQAQVPLLAQEESYFRLLRRATHREPARRFQSAAEMSEQLLGVLREVVSAVDGVPRPTLSRRFTPERRAFGTGAGEVGDAVVADLRPASVAAALPLPQVDVLDPGAGVLATLSVTDPGEVVRQLTATPTRSVEVTFRLVRARIEQGDQAGARAGLDELAAADPYDWRIDWYRGLAALAANNPGEARIAFDAVYDELPGEPAARLALAAAMECTGDPTAAERLYTRVWRVDHGYLSAAFGLARIRLAAEDRAGALAVLDQVPDSSSMHAIAQVAAVRASLHTTTRQPVEPDDLLHASVRLERLSLDVERRARLAVELLEAALGWITAAQVPRQRPSAGDRVLGHELTERGLRFGLEQAYRAMAQLARDSDTRIALVDRANTVRPRTLI